MKLGPAARHIQPAAGYKKQMLTAAHALAVGSPRTCSSHRSGQTEGPGAAEAALSAPTPAPPAARPSANVLTDGCLEISHKFNCVLIWVVFVSGSLIMVFRKVRDPQWRFCEKLLKNDEGQLRFEVRGYAFVEMAKAVTC